MKKYVIVTAFALATTITGAHAATIYTPPLAHEGGSTSFCIVSNVSSKVREVTVTIVDSDGAPVSGPSSFSIAPGAVEAPGTSVSGRRYCVVDVKGGKNSVRVSYQTFSGGQTQSVAHGF